MEFDQNGTSIIYMVNNYAKITLRVMKDKIFIFFKMKGDKTMSNEFMENEVTYEENNTNEVVTTSSDGNGVSLTKLLVGATLVGAGVLASKAINVVKGKKKQKDNEEPKKKVRKKLMWVEVPEEETTEVVDGEVVDEEVKTEEENK